jgi:hypothetical protein
MRQLASPETARSRRWPTGPGAAPLTSQPLSGLRGWALPCVAIVTFATLVWVLYGDALGYAFMYDDGLDLARGEQRSVLSLLTSGEGAFYYRPVPFLFWNGLHAAIGSYDRFWFHLPPLILHALNAWLVYRLGRDLGLGIRAGLLAAVLFVVFPFQYQVVPWAGALFHPLVTALLLGAVLAYRQARVRSSLAWLALSLALGGVALFTHESAVTLGALVGGMELWLYHRREVAAPRPYAALYLLMAAGFVLWWLTVPKWPRAYEVDVIALARNTLMFLQALLWPLAIGWRAAPPAVLQQPELTVGLAGTCVLALAVWLFQRDRALALLLSALGWVAITALPVWATLPTEYLEDGARLYYLPAVGVALAWAAVAERLARRGSGWRVGQVAVVLALGWTLWQSYDFLGVRRAMYAEGSELLRQVAALTAGAPADSTLLFVNLPAWRAPVEPAFPLGNTGVTFIPEYVLLGQALHVNGGGPATIESLATQDLPGGWPAHYGPHGAWAELPALQNAARRAAHSYLVQYTPQGLVVAAVTADSLASEPAVVPAPAGR